MLARAYPEISVSQASATATALAYRVEAPASYGLAPAPPELDRRFEIWRPGTSVRVVRQDSSVQFVASSRGQAGHLLNEAFELLVEMDARRARTSHLHPSFRS